MSNVLSRPILVLSPHLDDAALSCGGLLFQHSDALVATVFTADPPSPRPGPLAALATPEQRREEDAAAMAMLGAETRLLNVPDAIDRVGEDGERLYARLPALFGTVLPADSPICGQIVEALKPLLEGRLLLCPMAVGAHVDHQLCAHAGRRLSKAGHEVLFYEDAPYVYPDPGPLVTGDTVIRAAGRLRARVQGLEDVAIDAASKADVVACYPSQIADLFGDLEGWSRAIQSHFESLGAEIERLHHLRL